MFLTVALLAVCAVPGWFAVQAYRASAAYRAAEKALAAYDFPEARRHAQEYTRLRPKDPAGWILAAQAARRDDDLATAETHLDRAREQAGGSTPQIVLERAMLYAQQGRVPEVIDYLLSRIDAGDPASEQILEALAVGSVHVYRLDQASFWVHELLTKAPKNPIGRLLQAQTLETLGHRDRALAEMRELVADYPRDAKARLQLADYLLRAQKYEEAADHYRHLHHQRPDDPGPLVGLIRSLDRLGRHDEVRPLVQQLRERHPDRGEVLLESGRFALRDGRPQEAEPLLRRAVELYPHDPEVHLQYSACLQQLGRTDEARQHGERARQIEAELVRMEKTVEAMMKEPSNPAPRLEAGRICLRNGQVAEALRWFTGALAIAPDHKPTHQALADFYASQGDTTRAEFHRARAR